MTRNLRTQVVDLAEHALRSWHGDDITREDAERYLPGWRFFGGLDDDLRREVLSRFAPAEPPSVPGVDYLPDVTTVRTRSLSERREAAEAEAAKFNAEFPPGTRVEFWRGAREGKGRVSRTEGLAFATRSGEAVTFIQNTSGYIALSHVRPLSLVEVAPDAEALSGEVTSPFGPCNGLTADRRDNLCGNFATEYVSYRSPHWAGMTCRRLCTPCADAAPNVYSRKPLTTDPNGYPVERAS